MTLPTHGRRNAVGGAFSFTPTSGFDVTTQTLTFAGVASPQSSPRRTCNLGCPGIVMRARAAKKSCCGLVGAHDVWPWTSRRPVLAHPVSGTVEAHNRAHGERAAVTVSRDVAVGGGVPGARPAAI